jgi:hypothetical protein
MTFSAFLSLLTTHFFKVSDPFREVNATTIIFGYACGVSLLIYVLLRNWLTTRKLKSLSDQELIDLFIAGSRVFVQSMEDARKQQNWKSWKAFTDIKQAYFEMERRDRTLTLMLPLLRHDSDAVRMFASYSQILVTAIGAQAALG